MKCPILMLLSLASVPLPISASMILAILHLLASQALSTGYRGVMSRNSLSWRHPHGGFFEEFEVSRFLELVQTKNERLVVTRKDILDMPAKSKSRLRQSLCIVFCSFWLLCDDWWCEWYCYWWLNWLGQLMWALDAISIITILGVCFILWEH